MTKNHPLHIVLLSPWPLVASVFALTMLVNLTAWIFYKRLINLLIGGASLSVVSFMWWQDIIRETNFEGLHSNEVIKGLKLGIIFFISSEVLFFFSFFWAFFQRSISPNIEIGETWPPKSVLAFDPINIPLLNTLILLASGVTVTWSHHEFHLNEFKKAESSLLATIVLGGYFTLLQGFEYVEAPFAISDSVYGRTFFIATGFHGLHVIIGTTFLFICFLNLKKKTMCFNHIIGFETSAWYWHFVDVVWLFLYINVYWWSFYFLQYICTFNFQLKS